MLLHDPSKTSAGTHTGWNVIWPRVLMFFADTVFMSIPSLSVLVISLTCHIFDMSQVTKKNLRWILSSMLEPASSRTRIVARAGSASWPPNHCRNSMEILICSYVCCTPKGAKQRPPTCIFCIYLFCSLWFMDWIKSSNEFDTFAQVLLHCFETSLDL